MQSGTIPFQLSLRINPLFDVSRLLAIKRANGTRWRVAPCDGCECDGRGWLHKQQDGRRRGSPLAPSTHAHPHLPPPSRPLFPPPPLSPLRPLAVPLAIPRYLLKTTNILTREYFRADAKMHRYAFVFVAQRLPVQQTSILVFFFRSTILIFNTNL